VKASHLGSSRQRFTALGTASLAVLLKAGEFLPTVEIKPLVR